MTRAFAFLLFAAFLLTAPSARAAHYQADPNASEIVFSGTHAGDPFSGTFERFVVDIDFDPANIPATSVRATIDLASAKTGNAMFDQTLPSADWFNIKETPVATFRSTNVAKRPDGSYALMGDFTLRGITQPIAFAFKLDSEAGTTITARADLAINRLDHAIGKKSDPSAEWVSKDITIALRLTANKKDG